MNRSQFLRLCTGIIGGLGIHQVFGDSPNTEPESKNPLSDSYLVKGLTGMARNPGHWFGAHWGACILAGYYLCKENNLDERTVAAIKGQLDNVLNLNESQFALLPKEPVNEALVEDVPNALVSAVRGGLRAHGHAVIFASLSTKALRDVPQMAQPTLVNGLTKLSRSIAKAPPQKPEGDTTYADTSAMVEATFDSIVRYKNVLGRPSIKRPNFTHMITHTEALMNLEMMGHADLAKSGHAGHRAHISTQVPEVDPSTHPKTHHATLDEVMDKNYWENEQNQARWNKRWDVQTSRNGTWVASGHLFKVLYSYHRLTKLVRDKQKVRLCSQILLERYINPNVQGG